MGRDFTNFTRRFMGLIFDELFAACVKHGYNITMQKHASNYKDLEALFKNLSKNKYQTNIVLVLVPARVSWERCEKRNQINNMTLNTVSKDFHDGYIEKIPQTIVDLVYNYIFKHSYIESLEIVGEKEKITIDKNSNFDSLALKEQIINVLKLNN